MFCANCGGTLKFIGGHYVCDHCGSQYDTSAFYENIDAYICYIETDETGRRTKDAVLAQDIYRILEQAKINTFYARVSADRLAGSALEKACNAALLNAKTVLLLGTKKQHFEMLVGKYSAFYAGKVIIPVYTDMDAYDIPKDISAIQALDFNKVGASVDLIKSICNALGREQKLDYAALTKKSSARKKMVLWMFLSMLVAMALGFVVYCMAFLPDIPDIAESAETTQIITGTTQVISSTEENQENQYAEAIACVNSGDYMRAIELFIGLPGYKDSDKRLNVIYKQYAGYYQNKTAGAILRLQIWDENVAAIEFSVIDANGQHCKVNETFQLQGRSQKFEFSDSENNYGDVSLEFTNGGIIIDVKTNTTESDVSIGNISVDFLLEEKSDKPLVQIDAEMLLKWVRQKYTLQDIQRLGYEVEPLSIRVYKIKNTSIIFSTSNYDLLTYEPVSEEFVFVASGPVSIVLPGKIGFTNDPFVENEILYYPDTEIVPIGAEGDIFIISPTKTETHNVISEGSYVTFINREGAQEEYMSVALGGA